MLQDKYSNKMSETIIVTKQPTFCENTKTRCTYWCGILLMPVEYPAEEARGKGWSDPCNCLCGIICFAPKAAILVLVTPWVCCSKIDDIDGFQSGAEQI